MLFAAGFPPRPLSMESHMNQGKFNGDVSPQAAWDALAQSREAVLIDVRTGAEWAFVGGPDLSALGKTALQLEWQRFPGMARNEDFVGAVLAAGLDRAQPLYFICRSGVRSALAAQELARHGYATYNVADGFEGQLDARGRRGNGGWRALDLPWRQT